jgi:hypothetical protein
MCKACKVAFIGVLLAVIPAEKSILWAADAPSTSQTNQPAAAATATAPQSATYSGKVVVVDRGANTVTVEIEKRICLFKINPDTVILSAGKRVTLKEVTSGQPVTLELTQGPAGEVLVTSATVTSSKNETEAAGAEPKRKKKK